MREIAGWEDVDAKINFGFGQAKLRWTHKGKTYNVRFDKEFYDSLEKVPHEEIPVAVGKGRVIEWLCSEHGVEDDCVGEDAVVWENDHNL